MSSQTSLQIVQLCTIVIGFLGVAVALRSHRRQMHAQMYIEFSSRLNNLFRRLPAETWLANTGVADEIPPRSQELTKICVESFHIIADLYHLHQHGYVAPELWRPWHRGIKRALHGPVLQREWLVVETAFDYNPEFCVFVRRLMGESRPARTHSQAEGTAA